MDKSFIEQQETTAQSIYAVLTGVFVAALIFANLLGSTLLMNGGVTVTAGILVFPITFVLTDVVNEFYGPKGAKRLTYLGFCLSLLVAVLLNVVAHLPLSPHSALTQETLKLLAQQYSGLLWASLLAYLLSQLLDIVLFQWIKGQTGSVVLRATGSTIFSQAFDTVVFCWLAFGASLPSEILQEIMIQNYLWKLLTAVLSTPILYGVLMILRQLGLKSLQPLKLQGKVAGSLP